MTRTLRLLVPFFVVLSLVAVEGAAVAQPKDKKEHKVKQQKHHNGKDLVGDKIKKDGKHAFHQNGKNTASVEVKGGKIAGVTVANADRGNVPVKKYKSTKKMAQAQAFGIQPVSFLLAQATDLGTTWIGYSYVDEYGDEVIYWFPYEMILDGDTGAIDYVPLS